MMEKSVDLILAFRQNFFSLIVSEYVESFESFHCAEPGGRHRMVMIPKGAWWLGVRIGIQAGQFSRRVEILIESLPFLIGKNIEIILLVGHVADSSGFTGNPSEGIAVEVGSDLKSMDVRGNRVVAEPNWHLRSG